MWDSYKNLEHFGSPRDLEDLDTRELFESSISHKAQRSRNPQNIPKAYGNTKIKELC